MMSINIREAAHRIRELLDGYELCSLQAGQARELAEKLDRRQMTIAVIGQFKRGKTTLVNSILGEKLLPVGIVPITAAVTRISYRQEEGAEEGAAAPGMARVWFQNGLCQDVPAEELPAYVSEQENHNNERGVAEVEVRTCSPFLRDGLVLVDTPGVGSAHENNTRSAYDFARESDGVVFMLSVDSPINQIEIDFLKDTRQYAGKFYFVVNKIDTIDGEELEEYLEYCNALICSIMGIDPQSGEAEGIRLIPVSAKKDTGIDRLKEMILEDLSQATDEIMDRSAALKLLHIIRSSRKEISAYREVLKMAPNVFHSRFRKMHEELARRAEAADRIPLVNGDGSPRQYLRAQVNEEQQDLSAKTMDLFGIDYFYDIDRTKAGLLLSAEEYIAELKETYRQLERTLNAIFMYKEENAYTVARRIEDLNILIHKLDRYERQIAAAE